MPFLALQYNIVHHQISGHEFQNLNNQKNLFKNEENDLNVSKLFKFRKKITLKKVIF